jgi:hypothetical protein
VVTKNPALSALVAAGRSALDALEHLPLVGQPADEVRPLTALAEEWQIEVRALIRAAKKVGIAVRLGRSLVARRSAVVALVDELAAEQSKAKRRAGPSTDDAYEQLVASSRRRGKRAA